MTTLVMLMLTMIAGCLAVGVPIGLWVARRLARRDRQRGFEVLPPPPSRTSDTRR